MNGLDTQEKRLEFLTAAFIEDSDDYKDLQMPADTEGKKRLLRSLMNIRMPKPMDPAVLEVQDEYLRELCREKGIVTLDEIPTVKEQGSSAGYAELLSIWQGDITRVKADAIVNAANTRMLGCFTPMHSCIDNIIHTFAGIRLRAECAEKMALLRERYGADYEQPVSVPILTAGYNLPAGHVIHVAGPIVSSGLTKDLEEQLAACYKNSLDLCADSGLRSVVFCCISTGLFHFPNKRASEIVVKTVSDWLDRNDGKMDRIVFNVFKDADKQCYEQELF